MMYSSVYRIKNFNFGLQTAPKFPSGKCSWKAAHVGDYHKITKCVGHTTRKDCVEDGNCDYTYYDLESVKYFKEAAKKPSVPRSIDVSSALITSADLCR